jgi:hypothetical protein
MKILNFKSIVFRRTQRTSIILKATWYLGGHKEG